jgi:hypothetical protein
MSDEQKPKAGEGTQTPDPTKFVPKEEYEAQKSNLEKLQGDLERVKGQLLDPEYLEYLESKKNAEVKKTTASTEVKDALGTLTADEIERLPKARLLEIAEKRISEKLTGELRGEFNKALSGLQTTVQNLIYERELAMTKANYPDFDKYEKEIRNLLSQPGSNLSYEQAYKLARYEKGDATPDNGKPKPAGKMEKRSSGEKPSSTAPASDFEQKDYKDEKEASNAALASVRAKYGLEGDTL